LGIDVEEYGKIWEKYGENMEKSVENHTGTYEKIWEQFSEHMEDLHELRRIMAGIFHGESPPKIGNWGGNNARKKIM
jgi:hypothetical protein